MQIKTRFIISFGIFVVLILAIGASFSFVSIRLKKMLTESIKYSQTLSFWRELEFAFARQNRTIDYYLLFETAAEKESFVTQGKLINKKLEKPPHSDDISAVEVWKKRYSDYVSAVQILFSARTAALISRFEKEVEPLQKELTAIISANISDYEGKIEKNEAQIRALSNAIVFFSLVVGGVAFGIAIFLSYALFKTIFNPIHILEKGAEIIGGGNMNHRITLKNAPPEIKSLADNFNNMVENLSKLQLQIIQMDRMSSIGQLSGGVAHEINNPLTGVLGQAQLLLEKLPQDSPYRNHVIKIENAAQRCRKIVRSLLDFSRDMDYNFTIADVLVILNETLDLLSTEIQSKNIIVNKNYAPLPKIRVSASHIHQVFLNIITNAIQAIKSDGTITITTTADPSFVTISFKDTGCGIKKEYINHIFDPFFSTKDIGQGTGLGLTVCYGIIEKHNGTITAFSEGEGKGATITIKLPVKQ